MLTAVCATRTVTVGSASLSSVGKIGAVRSAARLCSAALGAGAAAWRSGAAVWATNGAADKAGAAASSTDMGSILWFPRTARSAAHCIMFIMYYYDRNSIGQTSRFCGIGGGEFAGGGIGAL